MSDAEAVEFRRQLMSIHFPGLLAWWDTLPEPAETWRVWKDTLRPYTLDECISVVRRWSDGTLQPFEAYERERVHLLIRAIVERDRSKSRTKSSAEALCKPVIARAGTEVAPALAKAIEMAKKGATEDEIQQVIDSKFPTSASYDQPTYRCLACFDRGYVEIWHPAEVVRFVEKLKDKPTCFCTIGCTCSIGNREMHKDYQRNVRYDPSQHCRVLGWDSLEQKRRTLSTWLQERQKIENHHNYSSDFGDYK